MASQGRKVFGIKVRIGDGASPEVFTKIDEVFSAGPIGGKKETVDMTSHDTLGYNDFQVFDLKDGNEVQFQAIDIDSNASQALVRTADANSTKDNWQVVDRNGKGYQFQGIIMSLETDYSELKGKVVLSWAVKICSTPTAVTVA